MARTTTIWITLLSAWFLSSNALAGGGWVHKKGNGYFKLGQSVLRASQFYEADGGKVPIFTTSVYLTSVYGEYGLSDRLEGVFYVPFFSRVTLNERQFASGRVEAGDYHNSVGDSRIGLKYGLVRNGPLVLSAGFHLGLPLGDDDGGETDALQTGDGEFNQLVRLDLSYAIPKSPLYASLAGAFNHRTNGFSEEWHLRAEVGYVQPKFVAILKFATVQSFKNGESNGSANGIFSNNLEFVSLIPELAYLFNDKWGVTANVGLALAGERVLASPNYSFGIFYNLRRNNS